jgi:hypothetical protein
LELYDKRKKTSRRVRRVCRRVFMIKVHYIDV